MAAAAAVASAATTTTTTKRTSSNCDVMVMGNGGELLKSIPYLIRVCVCTVAKGR